MCMQVDSNNSPGSRNAHTPTKSHPVNSQSGSQGNKNRESLIMCLPSQYNNTR